MLHIVAEKKTRRHKVALAEVWHKEIQEGHRQ
jgi:hypothetical protein